MNAASESILARRQSPYVSEYDARVKQWLEADLYILICRPAYTGKYGVKDFVPESELSNLTRAGAISAIHDNADWAMAVIKLSPNGKREDVSVSLARDILTDWINEGGNIDRDKLPAFVERHLSTEEIYRSYDEVVSA